MKKVKNNSNSRLFDVLVSVYVRGDSIDDALDKVAELLGKAKKQDVPLYLFDDRSEEVNKEDIEWVLRKAGLDRWL